MGEHTPGPWRDEAGTVYGADGRHVCTASEAPTAMGGERYETERANARLIAAAPELLEALEAFSRAMYRNGLLDDAWKQARTALALANKGRGE